MAFPASVASTLNPNAPLFVPSAFLAAEDFSPEWWKLVRTSPAFREYWLRERFQCEDEDIELSAEELHDLDVVDDADDLEFVFDDAVDKDEENNCMPESVEQNNLATTVDDSGEAKAFDVKVELLKVHVPPPS